ncbi:hypothetical protein BVG16_31355 [Paenibacillus selenitireducens]|uniref:Thioredoxin domain-containing protein n=1 Tax=Paenibacillus selenitireducens TaxID=1324314 RepID=A0A1T2WZR2_9BACL|nr:redoxin domain-containing protein [Paenibacillus selenitireducens]OPA72956.1 hypothetical protein BVG16_31355 [Paenibacillus selenitireducens]
MKRGDIQFRRIATILISIAAVIAILCTIVFAQEEGKLSKPNKMKVGSEAPDFSATTVSGLQVSLSAYRGKIVLINFWASYCKPCVREMPLIHQVLQSQDSEIETLFVNVGETKGTIHAFMKEHQFTFPVIIDITGKISKQYGITGLPATFIIDETGNFSKVVLGEVADDKSLRLWLERAKRSIRSIAN